MATTSNSTQRSRYVNMWAVPGLHPSNIELFQELKNADSQHYTHNMDTVGVVNERNKSGEWEKTHLIGIRTDTWQPDEKTLTRTQKLIRKKRKIELRKEVKRTGRLNVKQTEKLAEKLAIDPVMQTKASDIINQRLVLKLFKTTTKRLQWCGTIEEVPSMEIHNSLGTKKPLLTMAVILPSTKIVTNIQQNHRTARIPSLFSLCYFQGSQAYQLLLKRRWFSISADFDVVSQDKPLGLVDSKLLCLGSDSYLHLQDHPLADDNQFQDLMTLFAASVGYHKAMRRNLKQRIRANLSGKDAHCVTDGDEMRLHYNGRRAA